MSWKSRLDLCHFNWLRFGALRSHSATPGGGDSDWLLVRLRNHEAVEEIVEEIVEFN